MNQEILQSTVEHLGSERPFVTVTFSIRASQKTEMPCDWELFWHLSLWGASDKRFGYAKIDLLRYKLYNNKQAFLKATVSQFTRS